MEKNTRKITCILIMLFVIFALILISKINKNDLDIKFTNKSNEFRLISSSENSDLEEVLQNFASKNDIDLTIEYAGTIDIMDKLNSGEEYDAVWTSNSIWLYMLNSDVSVKNLKRKNLIL